MSEEEIIEENIRRYIKEHSTTIKAYTQEYVDKLQNQLQQKENIIKEVRDKIKEFCWDYEYETYSNMTSNEVKELAEILDKEDK